MVGDRGGGRRWWGCGRSRVRARPRPPRHQIPPDMTPFTTTRRVDFGDTDMAGIVHFANFFRFMESAETDFLMSRGMSVSWHDAGGRLGLPRVAASCDFQKPARFMDVLTITVTVERLRAKS